MRIIINIAFLLTFFYEPSYAQQIDLLINQYGNEYPQEKIYIHTDKGIYFNKETIWFKAYMLADYLPATASTNFYVELWDGSGKLLDKKIAPIWNATSEGHFTLPDTIKTQNLTIKAYTAWMLNFDTSFIYHKNIRVTGNSAMAEKKVGLQTSLKFFPEGGNFIQEAENFIAFKAVNNDGTPFDIEGIIKNGKGDIIESIKSIHNGMGVVKLTPSGSEEYFAEWKDVNGQVQKTFLPALMKEGIALHIEQVNNDLYYLLKNPNPTGLFSMLTVVASMYQKTVFISKIDMTGQTMLAKKFLVNTLPTGILQLTIFDQSNKPVAERIVFINNNNYPFKASINIKEKNTNRHGRNSLEIEVHDSIRSNLSLSVYDAGLPTMENADNIYSSLLMTSDLKGAIHQPGWYFENADHEKMKYLDLVMQTHGWRRYNWEKLIPGKLPVIKYPRDNYLAVSGRVTNSNGQPSPNEMVTLILLGKDSTKDVYTVSSNNTGRFIKDEMIFYDTATLYYQLGNSLNKNLLLGMNYNTYTFLPSVYSYKVNPLSYTTEIKDLPYLQEVISILQNYDPAFEKKSKNLQEVVLKSLINSKTDQLNKMEEKYAGGIFKTPGRQFDVLNDPMAANTYDVYNYLSDKIPTLRVVYKGNTKTLTYGFGTPLLIFINESESENHQLAELNVSEIAYIKVIERFAARQGLPAALAIYLKKASDYRNDKSIPTNLSKMTISGYSLVKEFYSPDYSIPVTNEGKADIRTTLYWNPAILTDSTNRKVPITFYNNDFTKKMKIVLEGMNEEGKLIHIEKEIN